MLKKCFTALLTSALLLSCSTFSTGYSNWESVTSKEYVLDMGQGWNLGNSFDSIDTNTEAKDVGEEAWGNPVVTKELIKSVKDKGFKSIRIPLTLYRRYKTENGTAVINKDYLNRYTEVVDYALDQGLYVVINIHHDSWIWINSFNGDKDSENYRIFTDLWTGLSEHFKDYNYKLSFETLNEPQFIETEGVSNQEKLDMLNLAAYNEIRNSGGNNGDRIIIIPTMHTNHGKEHSEPALKFIQSLNDKKIVATVHYYSEWVYSANLGKTGFDEVLWGDDYTPRAAADSLFDAITTDFLNNEIGVVIGEFGLLGYDKGTDVLQLGEELKYYEYMYNKAKESGVSLMFWDNGSGIDRKNYNWRNNQLGSFIEMGNRGVRSSYSTNLDTVYISDDSVTSVDIPLTLNGNEFIGIKGVNSDDYTYNNSNSTLTITGDLVKENGVVTLEFNNGADWVQTVQHFSEPKLGEASFADNQLIIPTDFNGTKLRRLTAFIGENRVGPNAGWWQYLEYGAAFKADYENNQIVILPGFFNDGSVTSDSIKFVFEFYDGQIVEYNLN